MRIGWRVAVVILAVCLCPAIASAQGAITGVVRDTSGAVLPGATVEASSPALIEKVRTATTDSTGQYRIEDLRPGTYVVTFTLAGFSTIRREDIVLTGSLAALVNAELRVGALEETITVKGGSPVVDVGDGKDRLHPVQLVRGELASLHGHWNTTAVPVHFCAAQQLFKSGTAPQVTFRTASAFNAAAFAFKVLMAAADLPENLPPPASLEQSALLILEISR